jgi:isopenicillin N synthase-like dioxygenase
LSSSIEEKNAIVRNKVRVDNGDGTRGRQLARDNMTGGKRDWQEAVDFYREEDSQKSPPYEFLQGKNLWPQRPAELKQIYEKYVNSILNLGEVLMLAMGTTLEEGNEEVFVRHTRKSFWGMRLIGYAPIPKPDAIPPEQKDDGISCGVHTDYGCVTFLLQDSTKGALQVKSTSRDWINTDPIRGAFVVNVGDMMERWTNGLWKSTVHRLIHRGEDFRVSVPFFFEPDFNAK